MRASSRCTGDCAASTQALASAAPSAATTISRRAGSRSARPEAADPSAPATKPSCTAIVSHAPKESPKPQVVRREPSTALAENHGDIASTSASAINSRVRVRPFGEALAAVMQGRLGASSVHSCVMVPVRRVAVHRVRRTVREVLPTAPGGR